MEHKVEYYDNGKISEERWSLNGKPHREDGPATIYYNSDGSVSSEYWHLNGKPHREDGPAMIYYNSDGSVDREEWYLNGKWHREDGPAYIEYNSDGSVDREEWCLNGKWHREDGPATIYYNSDGSVSSEYWYLNGKSHRVGGPAYIEYNSDGSVDREEWCLNGKWHREDGPAKIMNYAGNIYVSYCLNGYSIYEKDFADRVKQLALESDNETHETDSIAFDLKVELIEAVRGELDYNLYDFLKHEKDEDFQDFFGRLEFSKATDTTSWNRATVEAYSDLVIKASKLYFERVFGGIQGFIEEVHVDEGGWELDEDSITECVNYIESFLEDESYTANLNIMKPEIDRTPRI